jgi:hypothetical protein
MGAPLSRASAAAYTCRLLIPKYTPHESSESTAHRVAPPVGVTF